MKFSLVTRDILQGKEKHPTYFTRKAKNIYLTNFQLLHIWPAGTWNDRVSCLLIPLVTKRVSKFSHTNQVQPSSITLPVNYWEFFSHSNDDSEQKPFCSLISKESAESDWSSSTSAMTFGACFNNCSCSDGFLSTSLFSK